jgi:uncharacterized membrane protein
VNETMKRRTALLTGLLGAGLMYFADPVAGRRRRALIRDQLVHLGRKTNRAFEMTRRDVSNRVRGLQSEVRPHVESGEADSGSRFLRRPRLRAVTGGVFRRVWPPSVRVAVGAAGTLVAVQGVRRRSAAGVAAALVGLGLVARSVTNTPVRRLIGLTGRNAVDIQKAIHINAPVDRVFDVWNAYENFPDFMAHVRDVRMIAPDRSHWIVAGPGGVPIEWEAETTEFVPERVIGWETAPGSIIQHAGSVRFDEENGGTRVTIRMTYNPGTGMMGHALAELLGSDPKTRMDQDLAMMKSFIESGRQPRAAARARSATGGG